MLPDSEKEVILKKMRRYCVFQDRCQQEVRNKILKAKVYGQDLEEVITSLIEDDYINEERFARSFARGKFRIKQYGKMRIRRELKTRQISDYCIRKAMTEIEEEAYSATLDKLVKKYLLRYKDLQPYQQRKRAFERLVYKGYEVEFILERINEYMK